MYNIYLYVLKVIMITDALILMLSLNLSNCHYMCWLNSSMSIYYILYSIYYIWLKGVPRRIVWTTMIPLINYFRNAFCEHCPPGPPQSRAHQSQSLQSLRP